MAFIVTKDLSHFVTKTIKEFFEQFGIDTSFVLDEPKQWTTQHTKREQIL